VAYETRDDALAFIGTRSERTYVCTFCGKWHVAVVTS